MNIKTKIQHIQQLNVGIAQLSMLALVVLGKKPAVELDLYEWNTTPDDAMKLLGKIGLYAYNAGPHKAENPRHTASICISNNVIDARLLLSLVKIRETSKEITSSYHVSYGTLMGFPLTAIEGFITNKNFSHGECPLKDEEPLQMFTLSKAHWKKEIEVLTSWRKALKEDAPEILRSLDSTIVTKELI